MLIKMLETRRGCEDGHRVHRYVKGETYDMMDGLARTFMMNGWAYNAEEGDEPNHVTIAYLNNLRATQANVARSLRIMRGVPTNPQTYEDKGEPW